MKRLDWSPNKITLDVELRTDPGFEELAAEAVHDAERTCLVAVSLAVPVHVEPRIHTAPPLEAAL